MYAKTFNLCVDITFLNKAAIFLDLTLMYFKVPSLFRRGPISQITRTFQSAHMLHICRIYAAYESHIANIYATCS